MLKKNLLLIIPIILLTGCTTSLTRNEGKDTYYIQDNVYFKFYVDKATCVEYILFISSDKGNIISRLNTDGTVKLNTKCWEYLGKIE